MSGDSVERRLLPLAAGIVGEDQLPLVSVIITTFNYAGFVEGAIGAEFEDGMILDDYIRLVGMPTGGAVRVSLGLATNFADVYRFIDFATEFLDLADVPAGLRVEKPDRDDRCR